MSKLKNVFEEYGLVIVGIFAIIVVSTVGIVSTSTMKMEARQSVNIEDVVPVVINNSVHVKNNTGQWQGSGVFIRDDLILTARHVAETGEDFTIMTNDGKEYKADRAITSKKYDLGFIKLQECVKCTTVVGKIDECKLGQQVFAIGSPFGDINFNSVTAGIISSKARKLEEHGLDKRYGWSVAFQTDAAGNPGNSGCGVYTLEGKLIGILVGGYNPTVVYCIPPQLVTNDCQAIELMFLMDEYQHEIAPRYDNNTVYGALYGVVDK